MKAACLTLLSSLPSPLLTRTRLTLHPLQWEFPPQHITLHAWSLKATKQIQTTTSWILTTSRRKPHRLSHLIRPCALQDDDLEMEGAPSPNQEEDTGPENNSYLPDLFQRGQHFTCHQRGQHFTCASTGKNFTCASARKRTLHLHCSKKASPFSRSTF